MNQTQIKLKVLALAIYETMVFPSAISVVTFYNRISKETFIPTLAILARTFYSLNYYQRAKKDNLKCFT